MAKVVVRRRIQILQLVRREIVCSGCGAPSPYSGAAAVAKWQDREWYCRDCGSKHSRNKPQSLCVCGHRKYHHSGGKGRCQKRSVDLKREPHPFTELSVEDVNRLNDDEYATYSEKRRRNRQEQKHMFHCDCKRYTPMKEAKPEVQNG